MRAEARISQGSAPEEALATAGVFSLWPSFRMAYATFHKESYYAPK